MRRGPVAAWVAAMLAAVTAARDARRMRVLFFLHAINYDRVFENLVREILSRGHRVHVALDSEKRGAPVGSGKVFASFRDEFSETFSYGRLALPWDPFARLSWRLRLAIDYLRYLEPEYVDATALRERAYKRAPRVARAIAGSRPLERPRRRRALGPLLRWLERSIPIQPAIDRLLVSEAPDVVLVAPLVGLGSKQGTYVRAAHQRRIPVVLPVASWDNLTNKGVIREAPDLTIVWNERQVREAVELHGIPRNRVASVGAHSFDHWFTWQPARGRDEFLAHVGLQPGPFILYACSSTFIAGDEVEFVTEWIRRLRQCPSAVLRNAHVLIRPHPQAAGQWADADMGEPGRVVIYPRAGAAPAEADAKADYYDSIRHSGAMVGINTSALVEAAILDRPVLTILNERFHGTQRGTLHFTHLTGEADDGVLVTAATWEEHFEQLAACFESPGVYGERIRRFIGEFVQPNGMRAPAAPRAVDALEELARRHHAEGVVQLQQPDPVSRALTRGLATIAACVPRWLFSAKHRRRRVASMIRRTRARIGALLIRLRVRAAPTADGVQGESDRATSETSGYDDRLLQPIASDRPTDSADRVIPR